MKKRYDKYIHVVLVLLTGLLIHTSCSDMEKDFEPTKVKYPDITVENFSPKSGRPGTAVTITGTNFGEHTEAATVSFNGILADSISSYKDNEMVVIVPNEAGTGPITVKVWTHTKETAEDFTYIPGAGISDIEPANGAPGDQVTINGENFGTDAEAVAVLFAGDAAANVVSVEDTKIVVTVPDGGMTGPVTLKIGPQMLEGPLFSYPLIGLDFEFDVDDDSEGWVPQHNSTYEVSGGKLNVTFDPAQFGAGSKRRADLKFQEQPKIHAGRFPIVAIKMDKPEVCNLTFDTNFGSFGGGSNKWTGILIGDVYYFDLSATPFIKSGVETLVSTTEETTFTGFQFKIADVTSDEAGYSVDWIRSFESVAALKQAIALPEGKYIFEFDNAGDLEWHAAQNATYTVSGGKLNVTFDPVQFEGTNKRRADLQYTTNGELNGEPKGPWIYTSEYPILAIKYTKPEGGVIKPDMTGGDLGNNTYKTDFEGQNVYYYDLSEKFAEARVELPVFQFKIADITTPETGYEVSWIRTFTSVEELTNFLNN